MRNHSSRAWSVRQEVRWGSFRSRPWSFSRTAFPCCRTPCRAGKRTLPQSVLHLRRTREPRKERKYWLIWKFGNNLSSTYARLEVQFIVLAVKVPVNPVAVVGVPAHEAVDLPPAVPVVEAVPVAAVAVAAAVARETARQLTQLVSSVSNRT